MEQQTLLQELADNWFFLAMFTAFLGTIFWALRPGSRSVHKDTSDIPFRNEDYPGSHSAKGGSNTEEVQP